MLQSQPKPHSPATLRAFELFGEGQSVSQVVAVLDRAESTVHGYLSKFLDEESITDPTPWVDAELTEKIEQAIQNSEGDRLRPIFDALEGKVAYEQIRIVLTCLRNREAEQSATSPDS